MIHQLHNFNYTRHFIVACSAGVDSMSICNFYKCGSKNFSIAYFDHGTGHADKAIPFLEKWSSQNNVELRVGKITTSKPREKSPEEHWRDERYKWLLSFDYPIVTAHHLNDAVEQWIFSSLHGDGKIIRSQLLMHGDYIGESNRRCNQFVYRPFLTNTKQQLIDWCVDHNVSWLEDASNQDTHYPRNFIRHKLLPECLKINPGLFKVVKKKILARKEIE